MAQGARRAFWTAIMVIAGLVFIGAAAYLGYLGLKYWGDSSRYDEIADTAFDGEGGLSEMTVDWDALRAINPQVVAWVYVPGTRISYPVCWAKGDNQKYLDMNFDGNQGVFTGSGTIFLDGEAKPDFSCSINFLFGHHMNDGSMFACLSDFADEGTFEKSRSVFLLTPSCNYEFRTFALVRTVGSDTLVAHSFADEADRVSYVSDKESRSMVTPSEGFPDAKATGKLIALSTCDYNEADGRAVLFGSLVDFAVPDADADDVVGDAEGYAKPSA